MFKYDGRNIQVGRAWADSSGVMQSPDWHLWDTSTKAALGITEVIPERTPDPRLYTWSMDGDGKVSKSARNLSDVVVGTRTHYGVKSVLTKEVKKQQGSLLSQTDWAITRKSEKGTAIPSNVSTWRDAIRSKATAMEDAIAGAADTAAISDLFLVVTEDSEGNVTKSGILYDWPSLGS